MEWDVQTVVALPGHQLKVTLVDGRQGLLDMTPYLNRGSFQTLKDVNYFHDVGVLFGAITWPQGQDIAPETLALRLQPLGGPASTARVLTQSSPGLSLS